MLRWRMEDVRASGNSSEATPEVTQPADFRPAAAFQYSSVETNI